MEKKNKKEQKISDLPQKSTNTIQDIFHLNKQDKLEPMVGSWGQKRKPKKK